MTKRISPSIQGNLSGNLSMICLVFVVVALVGLWDGPNVAEAKALPGQGNGFKYLG
jgi:hypothetical protein